jgi:two-component system chemotaxis response regulator CheY
MAYILISDDSPSMRKMLTFTLTSANHHVIESEDGLQALKLAKTHEFDLIITDINMPFLDGLSLIEKLRVLPNYRFKPILVLTTETDPNKKKIAKSVGATGWITKPFDPSKLLAAIRKVV